MWASSDRSLCQPMQTDARTLLAHNIQVFARERILPLYVMRERREAISFATPQFCAVGLVQMLVVHGAVRRTRSRMKRPSWVEYWSVLILSMMCSFGVSSCALQRSA